MKEIKARAVAFENKLDHLLEWLKAKRTPLLPKSRAIEMMHLLHPRTVFLRTLPAHSVLLDMGAGEGSMSVLRDWPEPARRDISLYAASLEKGSHFDRYDGYFVGNWEASPPAFPDSVRFNALLSSHFIEHISRPFEFLAWACSQLPKHGRMYLEWPTEMSKALPPVTDFQDREVRLTISNFHDDRTHLSIPDRREVKDALVKRGFRIDAEGIVRFPFLEEELLAHCSAEDEDPFPLQFAYWSKTGWAQYLVAECVDHE